MSRTVGLLAVSTALLSCAPSKSPPVQMMVMLQDTNGVFGPKQVSVKTMSDVVGVNGTVATFTGGARIVVDQSDPALQTPGLTLQQVQDIFLKSKGGSVTASYIEQNGVLWPSDFHTWNMVTAYYGFEQAFDYFQNLGVFSGDQLAGASVYYFPAFTLVQQSPNPEFDNAFFFSPLTAFLLLPFDQSLQQVPLAMNPGVLGHEYSHRIFNMTVYQGEPFPELLTNFPSQQINLLKSIDEGFADYHAYGVTCGLPYGCTSNWLSDSFGASVSNPRDIQAIPSQNGFVCMSAGLANSICSLDSNTFVSQGYHYNVGTAFAAALWHAGDKLGAQQAIQTALLTSYTDTNPGPGLHELMYSNLATPQNVTLGSVANVILAHLPANSALQTELCTEFMDHLQLARADIVDPLTGKTSCPTTSTPGTYCPSIGSPPCPGF